MLTTIFLFCLHQDRKFEFNTHMGHSEFYMGNSPSKQFRASLQAKKNDKTKCGYAASIWIWMSKQKLRTCENSVK
jgi:hypothetical protein